ncbi:hypothetical protein BGW80DRAFT_1253089 [Lactifluus volemus]|nr:hypothetical protein BGW80DRAFT_1253089 [Lactifluus volemus]
MDLMKRSPPAPHITYLSEITHLYHHTKVVHLPFVGSRGSSQAGSQLKSHRSHSNFGRNRDYGNLDRGHQWPEAVDKATNYSHFSRDGGHDSGSETFGSRNGSIASSGFLGSSSCNGKKDENRRNFTDFKIVGLEIQDLSWTWGVIPASKSHIKAEPLTVAPPSSPSIGSEDAVSKATSQPAKKKPTDYPTSSINSRKDPVPRVSEDNGDEHQLPGNDPISKDGSGYISSLKDGVATQVDDSEGVRDVVDETWMDRHWIMFTGHPLQLRLPLHKRRMFPRLRTRQWASDRGQRPTAVAARGSGPGGYNNNGRARRRHMVAAGRGGEQRAGRRAGCNNNKTSMWARQRGEDGMAGGVAASSSRKGQARRRRRQWKRGEQLGSTAMDGPVGGSGLGGGIWWRPAKETAAGSGPRWKGWRAVRRRAAAGRGGPGDGEQLGSTAMGEAMSQKWMYNRAGRRIVEFEGSSISGGMGGLEGWVSARGTRREGGAHESLVWKAQWRTMRPKPHPFGRGDRRVAPVWRWLNGGHVYVDFTSACCDDQYLVEDHLETDRSSSPILHPTSIPSSHDDSPHNSLKHLASINIAKFFKERKPGEEKLRSSEVGFTIRHLLNREHITEHVQWRPSNSWTTFLMHSLLVERHEFKERIFKVGHRRQKKWEAGGERDEVSGSIEVRDGDTDREGTADVPEMLAVHINCKHAE